MNDDFLHNIEYIVERLGYECVHAGVRTDFGRLKLQILIDTLGGINAGDCELVSGHVSKDATISKSVRRASKDHCTALRITRDFRAVKLVSDSRNSLTAEKLSRE